MNKTRTCSESTIKNGKKEDLIYLLLARNQGNESIFISVGGRKVFGIKNSIWMLNETRQALSPRELNAHSRVMCTIGARVERCRTS